jgi:glycosyltransferase involved in cell wall biosynthesis
MTSNQTITNNKFRQDLKVALVHDFLNQYGGAERVLLELHEMFPGAPIFTLLYDPKKMRGKFKDADIRPSFLQKFPKFLKKRHKYMLPFMPTAPETFNLRDFDLVISSSSAFAKGVVIKPKTTHICYCHSPMRYVWDWNEKYLDEQSLGKKRKIFVRLILNYVRMWDRVAADRADYFIANSKATRDKIKKYYGRESVVVYPPVDIVDLELTKAKPSLSDEGLAFVRRDYFLIVSRLAPYKKIEVAIEAMNKLNLPLVVIGEGAPKYEKYLKSIAGPKTKFLGWMPDEKVKEYYRHCRAFILPGEEDFGITIVEAMSFGKPVIALRKGGAIETVIEGETGEFFNESAIEVIADAVRRFMAGEKDYDREKICEHAQKYSKENFRKNIKRVVGDVLENFGEGV